MINFEILALMNAVLLGLSAFALFSASRSSAVAEALAASDKQEISTASAKQLLALRNEIGALKGELNQLMCTKLEARSGGLDNSAGLKTAAMLASGGMAADEIANSCGISPAEAKLVVRMGQAKA